MNRFTTIGFYPGKDNIFMVKFDKTKAIKGIFPSFLIPNTNIAGAKNAIYYTSLIVDEYVICEIHHLDVNERLTSFPDPTILMKRRTDTIYVYSTHAAAYYSSPKAIRDGSFVLYGPSEEIIDIVELKNNRLNGPRIQLHFNGKLKSIEKYKNDKLIDKNWYYDANGKFKTLYG